MPIGTRIHSLSWSGRFLPPYFSKSVLILLSVLASLSYTLSSWKMYTFQSRVPHFSTGTSFYSDLLTENRWPSLLCLYLQRPKMYAYLYLISRIRTIFAIYRTHLSCRTHLSIRTVLLFSVFLPSFLIQSLPLIPLYSACRGLLLHVISHSDTHSVWLPWMSDRPVPEVSTCNNTTDTKDTHLCAQRHSKQRSQTFQRHQCLISLT
jgi:hypothetical protein